MANQKEIRARISSTISTQQITKAMKLVSATKLRKASEVIIRMRPYAQKLQGIMGNLQDSTDDAQLAGYFETREVKRVLLLVITSDRGLCGGFNANVVKRVRQLLDTDYATALRAGNVTLMCMGKKGGEALKRLGYAVNMDMVNLTQNADSQTAFAAMQSVIDSYLAGHYDRVEVIYNKFKNAATQILVNEQLLPVVPAANVEKSSTSNDYIFEPDQVAILQDLIPRSLSTLFYRSLLDSLASEHGARMVAMDKATENAGDLLRAFRLAYNQARQAAITREISEIVGGVAALEG
ncbi:MAG: ATP synthase F1 subunit gamma [Bacteroidetes bacterium]|nr:ATP synthase F1 subunit gamma [Bacteroidota bacterium]MDA1223714.1 ATP synthase F1 subunit gamma [Bacteroidota bacterium]